MSDDEPDWDLLPDRPEEFFQLTGEYDRRDLKRAYTRLIKRFKPERHPDEFRRIRAAYEVLDERLRYGSSSPFASSAQLASLMRSEPSIAREEAEPGPAIDAVALVRERGAEGARAALREAAGADPEAWARLALLDDVIDDDPLAPYRTLVAGASATQGHPATVNLLSAFLHEELEPSVAVDVLSELAGAVSRGTLPPGTYWFLTDSQWTRLVGRIPFDDFDDLLRRCSAEVGEEGRSGELVLLLRLRRRAAMEATDEWLDRVDGEIHESLQHMPPWAGMEFDIAEWLSEYRDVRPEFVDGSDIRDVLDAALVAIVTGDEVRADRAFLVANGVCVDRTDELVESLGRGDLASGVVIGILHWFGDEWREREEIEEDEPGEAYRKAVEFTRRLDRRSQRSIVGAAWNISLAFALFVAIGVLFGVSFFFVERVGNGALMLPIVLVVVAIAVLQRGWLATPLRMVSDPFARYQHRWLWRPMTMEFLEQSRVPYPMLIQALSDEEDSPTGPFELEAIAMDHAIALYSNAVRAMR